MSFWDDLYKKIISRAKDRRENDKIISTTPRKDVPDPGYRPLAMLCYAYSITSEEFYVGYSGTAGGMKDPSCFSADKYQKDRRIDRFHSVVGSSLVGETPKFDRTFYNCAEACALTIALSYDEKINDLVFISINKEGVPVPPCRNCQIWLERAGCHAYWGWTGKRWDWFFPK